MTRRPARTALALSLAALALAAATAAPASAAQPASQAVVLVCGLDCPTPYTTPDPQCSGKEGDFAFLAAALKAQGYNVYTAPEQKRSNVPAPCGGTPPASAYIDSTIGIDANGKALAAFLAWLQQQRGVSQARLVGMSFGGLWSRSAITQYSAYGSAVAIPSLTTLGTPHTGAFSADLLEGAVGADCSALQSPAERAACRVFKALAEVEAQKLGPEAVQELTSTYVGGWNPGQQITACPVTPVAGTFVSLGPVIDGLFGPYYLPDDGLVGLGSAAATTAPAPFQPPRLPGLQPVAAYPVVHSAQLSFLSTNNLLNQPDIAARVGQALAAPGANCADVPPVPPVPPTPPTPPTPPSPPKPYTQIVTPFTEVAPHRGWLRRPQKADLLLVTKRSRVRCGKRRVKNRVVYRQGKFRVILAPRCRHRLRVTRKPVLLLHPSRSKQVSATVTGKAFQMKLRRSRRGVRLAAQAQVGTSWRTLRFVNGKATLPTRAGDSSVPVEITVRGPGRRSRAIGLMVARVPG